MQFNSLQYAFFLPVVVAVYFLAPARFHKWILLVASYLFYASWNPVYLLLIIGLTAVNFGLGLALGRSGQTRTGRLWLTLAVVVNVGTLLFFKYTYLALQTIFTLSGHADQTPDFSPILPLGISFFVFEFIHYQVDIWRGHAPLKSPLDFAVFAAFFPTQIAGPIKRFENFGPQLRQRAAFNWDKTWAGLHLIVIGLFKKIILADNLAPIVLIGFQQLEPGNPGLSALDAWLVIIAFGTQLFFDFSGYTDIGRGSALLLGFDVPKNFLRPALATSVLRFWGRWHLSLTSWLTDYIYTPLGGKRHRYRNIFLTMVVGGLWHGASWNFAIWGALNGVFLAAYWFLKLREWLPVFSNRWLKLGWTLLGWVFTNLLIYASLAFFRASSFDQAIALLGSLFGWEGTHDGILLDNERNMVILIFAGRVLVDLINEHQRPLKKWLAAVLGRSSLPARFGSGWLEFQPVGYAILIAVIILFRPTLTPRFIYFQF